MTIPADAGQPYLDRQRPLQRPRAKVPYCRTNGCTTILTVDPQTGRATCRVCGFVLLPRGR
jgi:hypothetical protein